MHTAPHWLSTNADQLLVHTAPHQLSTHAGQLTGHAALHSSLFQHPAGQLQKVVHAAPQLLWRHTEPESLRLSHPLWMLCFSRPSLSENRNLRGISRLFPPATDSSHPSFSMKLIHRAASQLADSICPDDVTTGWHCIIRLQRQLYLIADNWWNFLPGSKDVAKPPDIVLSLSFVLSIGLSQELPRNCQL